MALAFAAVPLAFAQAQTASSSVETYVEEALPTSPSAGIMPDGVEWNHPLKAGDMVLPRKTEPRQTKALPSAKKTLAPVGDLQAPVLPSVKKTAQPPQIATDRNSTASVMLLQGMKNALQQAGANPDIPQSTVQAPQTGAAIETVATDLKAPTLAKGTDSSLTIPAPVVNAGIAYEPGQEPKSFVAPATAPQTEEAPAAPSATTSIVFPPEMAKDEEPSSPLAVPVAAPETETPVAEAPAARAEGDSIFGSPVREEVEKQAAEDWKNVGAAPAAAAPAVPEKGKKGKTKCVPSVEKWTRDCQDAGYPDGFVGQIVGETRVQCPSGDAKDVWLSNSCAAPGAAPQASPATDGAATRASVVVPADDTSSADGACGVANGLAALAKPTTDLCAQGESSAVQGEGPWRWSCKGRRGGMTVSCAAPLALPEEATKTGSAAKAARKSAETATEDGACGPAAQGSRDSAPTEGLCAKGTAGRVNGGGPWTWACSGINGGQAAACTANKTVDGACGSASRDGADGMPMKDLCAAGYASAVTGDGPWHWTCSGLYGGQAAMCEAKPKVNAVCGPASTMGHRRAPQDGLCQIGTASAVGGDGPWHWTCSGQHGGAAVSCEASASADGVCGSASGSLFEKAPSDNLCASGRASRVTGQGPWTWTCAGAEGGNTSSCTASVATKEALASMVSCGPAAETPSLFKPEGDLCGAGKPSAVGGDGPWSWSCSDGAGHSVACKTLSASEGACGKAANVATSFSPSSGLCAGGTPSAVTADQAHSAWTWACEGAMGGGAVDCSAPMTKAAVAKTAAEAPSVQCGAASGQAFATAPEVDLCANGKSSALRGNGPWTWTCAGTGKNAAKVYCEAQKTADGACGTANGSIQRTAPATGLCAAGTPTGVTGEGPWMWSCVGAGGGSSASCSALAQAQTKVDGTCGAAANASMTTAPEANLCDSGAPSTVYGEGPWTWTCSGLNGGIASTCSTSKIVPKAPPPPGPFVNGLCGPANGVASVEEPTDGLCSTGTATATSGNGPWNWSCIGANGGMTVSCTAPLMPPAPIVGTCGAASGVPTLAAPRGSLCSAGIASAVSGKGPWTWSCSGTNGGGAVSCVAPLAGAGGGALPSLATPSLDNGEAPAPAAAPAGLVTPTLPSGPLPPLKGDAIPNRKYAKGSKLPKESSALPAPKLQDLAVPAAAPSLPDGTESLTPPPRRDDVKPLPGLKPPVLDSEGNPIPGARLALKADVSTISFAPGSDQLDKDAVKIVEKLAAILEANGAARITLIAYSDVGNDRPPREARRLSLNRALAIRDFLASKGVPSSRVDVRPMGANVPSGDMDRVDIRVN